ncbi:hypothetical protein GCM10009425_49340 [Pseudomonas asuensis]|uniref:Uncharacterized protein n=1 Tax=Pseudomonas asuensis TaxID=1825787 RepID=A0ABQ2H5A3_9PSED|nr:hypothetical protein GCM10009425_49340 [Pseudomonas asuensis]
MFSGTLVGNYEHVFVMLTSGQRIDLNEGQPDVMLLGERAHVIDNSPLHTDYRESLASCLPRVKRWAGWVLNEYALAQCAAASPVFSAKIMETQVSSQLSK